MWSRSKFEEDKELLQNFGGESLLFTQETPKRFEINIKKVGSKEMR